MITKKGTARAWGVAKKEARTKPTSGPIVALSLARDMADAVQAGEEDRDEIISAALMIGQWLADVGRPGRWETIEVASLIDAVNCDSEFERGRFILSLTGLIGFAALTDRLQAKTARRLLDEVALLSHDPILSAYAHRTIATFGAAV